VIKGQTEEKKGEFLTGSATVSFLRKYVFHANISAHSWPFYTEIGHPFPWQTYRCPKINPQTDGHTCTWAQSSPSPAHVLHVLESTITPHSLVGDAALRIWWHTYVSATCENTNPLVQHYELSARKQAYDPNKIYSCTDLERPPQGWSSHDFKTDGNCRWKGFQPSASAAFTPPPLPQRRSQVLIFVTDWVHARAIVEPDGSS
jgi:hypothetical protein